MGHPDRWLPPSVTGPRKAEEQFVAPKRRDEKKASPIPPQSRTTEDVLIERKIRKVNKRWGWLISKAAAANGIAHEELTALIALESGGNPRARSTSGACGLTQLKKGAAKDVGVTNCLDPRQSIFGGAEYLALLKKQGYQTAPERFLAYHDGARGAKKFLKEEGDPRKHFYVWEMFKYLWHAERLLG